MSRIKLKIWRAPLATLQTSLDEGEIGIVEETGQFVRRPDGQPTGALVSIGGSATPATASALGSVKVGQGLAVAVDGTLSASPSFASITSKPTTVEGYGIVDALTVAKLGAANGAASLGSDGKIPASQIPALAITDTFTVNSQAEMLALPAERGDVAIRLDVTQAYILAGTDPTSADAWLSISAPVDLAALASQIAASTQVVDCRPTAV